MSAGDCELLCLDAGHAEQVRAQLASGDGVRRAAERAKALGDPTRLRIAAALAVGDELCVCDLAWITELAQNLVSHHLRTLRSAGLADSRREGKLVMYRLTDDAAALLRALGVPALPVGA